MRILSRTDILQILTMDVAINLMKTAMIDVSAGHTNLPLRSAIDVGGNNKMGIMSGAMLNQNKCFGAKILSLFPDNPSLGYSSHGGAMILFESQFGMPIAMMNSDLLTAIRTAAVSGVATDVLARKDTQKLTIIGTGEQAEYHLDAMLLVRAFKQVTIVGRNAQKLDAFIKTAKSKYPMQRIIGCKNIQTSVSDADVVCTVTNSCQPILMGDWIRKGVHLNVVGASIPSKQEIDQILVKKANIFVDYRPSTFAQAGEIIEAIKSGLIDENHLKAEIGEVISGAKLGRNTNEEITLYRSLGVVAQDLVSAFYCIKQATTRCLGVHVSI